MASETGDKRVSQPETSDSTQMGKRLLLEKIYYGKSTGALRGPAALYARAQKEGHLNITLKDVKAFLKSQPTYSRFRPARRKYPRNKVIAHYCGEVFQIDIMDMQNVVVENDGYKYVLLGYDTFSKYLIGFPLKDRKPYSVILGLKHFLENVPFSLANIYWDKEGSFLSKQVQNWLLENDIHNYTTTSIVKAPGVERVIRTLRVAMARFFNTTETVRWLDFLPRFINSYNNRTHSTTRLRPIDVVNDPMLIPRQVDLPAKTYSVPSVGSFVRLNRIRGIFGKEFTGNWTSEVFKVVKTRTSTPIPMISVEDLTGEPILGMFYPEEVQEIDWDGKKRVESVVKTRVRDKNMQYLVSFVGYPAKYYEWIDEKPNV